MQTKQQRQQEKRLAAAKSQAKRTKADLKATPGPNRNRPPDKKGGLFQKLLTWFFGRKDKPQSAQQSIPYRQMYRDGICRVNERLYTKTVVFQDINYQLAQNDDKTLLL